MTQCCPSAPLYHRMALSQDGIGWRRFMEGMVSRRVVEIQADFFAVRSSSWKLDKWATGLVTRLLEVTHGQWLYRNVLVHDKTNGQLAMIWKEDIAARIEEQLLLGHGDLLDEDQYLLGVNLGDLRDSTGESQEYWLLAIQAARVAGGIAMDRLLTDGTDYR